MDKDTTYVALDDSKRKIVAGILRPSLGGHLKTGQLWTPENRPVREPPQARVFYRVRS